jgi:hypothetical protein
MRNLKHWSDFLKENSNPSTEDLQRFFKDFMAGNTQLQKHHKNYKVDVSQIREMVKSIVYTPELLAELGRRKVEIPDVSKMKMKIERKEYHRCFEYILSDTNTEDEKFNVTVTIEVPYEESFEDDNTMITACIFVKNRGKFKGLFGYANKRAQKDNEFNLYGIGDVLQKSYKDLTTQMI